MAPVPPYNFRDEDFQDVGLGSRVSGFRVYLRFMGTVVISGVISRLTIVITHLKQLITPLITTHEPPSRP